MKISVLLPVVLFFSISYLAIGSPISNEYSVNQNKFKYQSIIYQQSILIKNPLLHRSHTLKHFFESVYKTVSSYLSGEKTHYLPGIRSHILRRKYNGK